MRFCRTCTPIPQTRDRYCYIYLIKTNVQILPLNFEPTKNKTSSNSVDLYQPASAESCQDLHYLLLCLVINDVTAAFFLKHFTFSLTVSLKLFYRSLILQSLILFIEPLKCQLLKIVFYSQYSYFEIQLINHVNITNNI